MPGPQPTSPPLRWAIAGGGVLGMTLALRLRQAGHEVTLFEAAEDFGGLAAAWDIGGLTWDKHYHVTLLSDLNLRAVLGELGLDDDMKWVETKTGFYTGGRHYSMSSSVEFLKFPPLTLIEKFRLGATIFFASKIKNWEKLEGVTAAEWLEKWSGEGVFQKIWLPLLRAKLGDNYHLASAAFIWAIIARMYAARRSGLKKEMFGYLPGGYAAMLDRFVEVLREAGVELRPGSPIDKVSGDNGVSILLQNGAREEFDRCALTLPSPAVSKFCPDLSPREHGLLNGIRYQGIVCASVLMKKPLEGYYVTNITDDVPFTAVIEMTALVDPDELGGNYLVYLPWYVDANDDGAFSTPDGELRERFWSALKSMHPKLTDDDLVEFKVSRARNVMALSTLGYSQSLPPRDTSVQGVHVVNSAMICNGTLNVNETIGIAEEAAVDLAAMPALRKEAAEVA